MPEFQEVIEDPEFKRYHIEDKRRILKELFPNFDTLSIAEQNRKFRELNFYPGKGPEERPEPSEQKKIYSFLESMPPELSREVKEGSLRYVQQTIDMAKNKPFTYFDYAGETVKNIPRNARDIVKETGALLLGIGVGGYNFSKALYKDMVSQAQGEPETELNKFFSSGAEMLGKMKKEVAEGYKEFKQHPAYSIGAFIKERPLDSMILGNAVKTAIGRGVNIGAKGLQKVVINKGIADKLADFASTERTPLSFNLKSVATEVDEAGKPFQVENIIKDVKFAREYSKDSLTKYLFERPFDKLLDKYPTLKNKLAEKRANKLIDSMRNTYEELAFKERLKYHSEVLSKLNKMTDEELELMTPYLEGRLSFVKKPSDNVQTFEKYYRDLGKQISSDLKQISSDLKLTDEIIDNRAYQPLMKATGLPKEQIKAELGDFTPVYIRHVFERYPQKMGIHFTETTGQRFKPGFFKKSKRVEGYSENLKEVLPRWLSEYVKFKNTEAFISDLTDRFGVPANLANVKNVKDGLKVRGKLYPGYKILAPDGYLRFFRGKIDLYKETLKQMRDMDFDEAIGEAIGNMLIDKGKFFAGGEKSFLGVTKNQRVYLIPENIAKRLESHATPLFGSQRAQDFVKIVYDKPVGVWKDTILAASPRWVKNNVLGDIIFNTMEGVGPLSYGRSFLKKYKNVIPEELVDASFANVMKYNPKLGSAAKTTIGQMVDKLSNTRAVNIFSKVKDFGYALNTMFEKPFVRSLYTKLARDKAKNLLRLEKKPVNSASILNKMETIKNSKALKEPIIKRVQDTLPVFNLLGNYERKYARRLMPFYNWYKFMAKYAVQLPKKHPFKLVGARGLGALSEEARKDVYKDYFPYMSREIEENGIPDRFDNLWPVGYSDSGKAIFWNSRGMNVFATIEDMINLDFMNMMSPVVKVPMEIARGEEEFSRRKYETAEQGLDFEEFKKQRPPLGEHILKQFPQYTLLKQFAVPARQYDSGTLFNPEPILDHITGEYKYPIDNIEKVLNFIGVDRKTLDVRETWDRFKKKKSAAITKQFKKQQSKFDTALSFNEIKEIFRGIRSNRKLWGKIQDEIRDRIQYKAKEQKRVINIIKE